MLEEGVLLREATMSVALRVRRPAVAGSFYPADRTALASMVDRLLTEAGRAAPGGAPVPKALIVPHAGYVYSGPVAASGYVRLGPAAGRVTRVVLAGPAHRVWFEGVALPDAERLQTPLGEVPAAAVDVPGVFASARAHADEHALEVHLPFIQRVLGGVEVVPLLVGDAPPEAVAAVFDALWGGPETVIVVSSDLSHYHAWDEAVRRDTGSAGQIEALGPPLTHDQACGATPVNALLVAARRRGLRVERVDLRNSGDTAGGRDQVVGYGAFAFFEPAGGG
jgi:AmmeMemoRadiSam system protein B